MSKIIQLPNSLPATSFTQNGKVRVSPPPRQTNAERRSREYLTSAEVEALMSAAGRTGRHGHRDKTLILIAYRHGLRVSELIDLRLEQVLFEEGLLRITGKGNKERYVPAGAQALDALKLYIARARPLVATAEHMLKRTL